MNNKITPADFNLPDYEYTEINPAIEIIENNTTCRRIGWYTKEVICIGIVNARAVVKGIKNDKQ